MLLPSFPWVGTGAVLLGLAGWVLSARLLHPAWRKERRVIRACEKAFGERGYKLTRLRVDPGEPSIRDLFPRPLGLPRVPKYFTYDIETIGEQEPDFSGMSREEISLVRHYLNRDAGSIPHHGREVLRPDWKEDPSSQATGKTEKIAPRSSPT